MKVLLLFISLVTATLVQAQHKILEMNPPKAKPFMKNQLHRMEAIREYKLKGIIGETDSAMLAVRETGSMKPDQVKKVKDLVAAENKDRTAIYNEIGRFNKLNEKEKDILIRSAYETSKNRDIKNTYFFEKNAWHKKY